MSDTTSGEKPESASVNGDEITILPDEVESDEILGWVATYTIGRHFPINHDWLCDRADEHGLSQEHLPTGTTPKVAFKRAAYRRVPRAMNEITPGGVKFVGNKVTADIVNLDVMDRRSDANRLDGSTLCSFVWDSEHGEPRTRRMDASDTDAEKWFSQARELFWERFATQKESVMAQDVSRAIRRWIKENSASVKMRDGGAVYFVPRSGGEVLDGWKNVAADIDEEVKSQTARNHECAIDVIEVVDSEGKREMVERKARNQIDTLVSKAVDGMVDALDEDTAATAAVSEVADKLVRAENVAVEHNALLDVEMSIKQELAWWKEQMKGSQKQQVVEAAMSEVEI